MKKSVLILALGMIPFVFLHPVLAQTSEDPALENDAQKAPVADDNMVDETGIKVKEIRIRNRLDQVIIQRGEGGLSEYYDFGGADEIYQDGSLTERGVLRQWRIGGKP